MRYAHHEDETHRDDEKCIRPNTPEMVQPETENHDTEMAYDRPLLRQQPENRSTLSDSERPEIAGQSEHAEHDQVHPTQDQK